MKKETSPYNKIHFQKLKTFGKKILKICKENRVNPILYGSYMLFYYTRENTLKINDLDFYVKEKDFVKLIKVLKHHKINFNYSKEWHTLQIFKGKFKIEFDSIDFWYKGPKEFITINLGGIKVKALSMNSLKRIYKRASERSKDNPEGNKKKYEMLMRIG